MMDQIRIRAKTNGYGRLKDVAKNLGLPYRLEILLVYF